MLAAAPLGVASGARRLLSGGRASPHRGKDPSAQVKGIETRSDKLASTAPSAGPGRCLRMGGFWALPPFSALPGSGVGSGRFGPGRSLGRSSLAPYRWHRAWLSRAVVPSCREFHGVLRRRRQSARRRPCAAYAVSALCLASLVPRPGLGPLARAGRETGSRRGLAPLFGSAGALPAVDPPLPSRWVGVAHPQRIVVGGGGGPARRARPAPVWPWVRVSLPVGPPGSGVGIWLRTLGAFVAPRVG